MSGPYPDKEYDIFRGANDLEHLQEIVAEHLPKIAEQLEILALASARTADALEKLVAAAGPMEDR